MSNDINKTVNIENGEPAFEKVAIKNAPGYLFFKRAGDILFSLMALLVGLPIMLVIALIIVIDSPGASPIYVQRRVGFNGKNFRLYKFRTMVANADGMLESILEHNEMEGPVFKIKDDPRITRIGRFLRRSSLDELPQFWNVFKGDMTLVGPRPPLPREVDLYTDYQRQRLFVKPGLTCYWQVSPKRNDLSFDQWLKLDFKYMRERSLKVDLILLFKTVVAICGLEGE